MHAFAYVLREPYLAFDLKKYLQEYQPQIYDHMNEMHEVNTEKLEIVWK